MEYSLNSSLRLFAFIILFAVVIINDIPFKKIYKEPIIQLYLAIVALFILMFIDNITGFIITLGLLTLYFRIYSEEIKNKKELARLEEEHIKEKDKSDKDAKDTKHAKHDGNDKCTMDMPCHKKINENTLGKTSYAGYSGDAGGTGGTGGTGDANNMRPYITEENLLAAQTNIIDVNNYNNEVSDAFTDKISSNANNGSERSIVLYRSQGLNNNNSHIQGYDINNVYLGSLNYELL